MPILMRRDISLGGTRLAEISNGPLIMVNQLITAGPILRPATSPFCFILLTLSLPTVAAVMAAAFTVIWKATPIYSQLIVARTGATTKPINYITGTKADY